MLIIITFPMTNTGHIFLEWTINTKNASRKIAWKSYGIGAPVDHRSHLTNFVFLWKWVSNTQNHRWCALLLLFAFPFPTVRYFLFGTTITRSPCQMRVASWLKWRIRHHTSSTKCSQIFPKFFQIMKSGRSQKSWKRLSCGKLIFLCIGQDKDLPHLGKSFESQPRSRRRSVIA